MDDTELYADLELENDEEQTLEIGDDAQTRYLDLEVENEVLKVNTGGDDVYDGVLTIKQGDVVKGTFSANQKTNATIELDAGGGECEVTKAEFDAEVTRAKAAEQTNADNITAEETRAKAKEDELEAKFPIQTDSIEDKAVTYDKLADDVTSKLSGGTKVASYQSSWSLLQHGESTTIDVTPSDFGLTKFTEVVATVESQYYGSEGNVSWFLTSTNGNDRRVYIYNGVGRSNDVCVHFLAVGE